MRKTNILLLFTLLQSLPLRAALADGTYLCASRAMQGTIQVEVKATHHGDYDVELLTQTEYELVGWDIQRNHLKVQLMEPTNGYMMFLNCTNL